MRKEPDEGRSLPSERMTTPYGDVGSKRDPEGLHGPTLKESRSVHVTSDCEKDG